MRAAHDEHPVPAAVGADAARALLARTDHRLRGAGHHRPGLVRQAPLPREDREAAHRGVRTEPT